MLGYPICDVTKGEKPIEVSHVPWPPRGAGDGDYGGGGWTPLGVTGWQVRVWVTDGQGILQWKPHQE